MVAHDAPRCSAVFFADAAHRLTLDGAPPAEVGQRLAHRPRRRASAGDDAAVVISALRVRLHVLYRRSGRRRPCLDTWLMSTRQLRAPCGGPRSAAGTDGASDAGRHDGAAQAPRAADVDTLAAPLRLPGGHAVAGAGACTGGGRLHGAGIATTAKLVRSGRPAGGRRCRARLRIACPTLTICAAGFDLDGGDSARDGRVALSIVIVRSRAPKHRADPWPAVYADLRQHVRAHHRPRCSRPASGEREIRHYTTPPGPVCRD